MVNWRYNFIYELVSPKKESEQKINLHLESYDKKLQKVMKSYK